MRYILPGLYVTFACYVWVYFVRTNLDGLANIGLFIVTLPATLVELLLRSLLNRGNVLTPQGHGYLTDHALFYAPAVLSIAALLWWLGRSVDRRLR